MTNAIICPVCNEGHLHSDTTLNRINVANGLADVTRHFHWCDSCGVELALDQDVRINAREALRTKQLAQGRLTGQDIRSLREKLCINQAQAAKIFGGGPIGFSKYENNEIPPVEAMDNLLWLVNRHPELLFELATRSKVALEKPKLETSKISQMKSETLVNEIKKSQMSTVLRTSAKELFAEARRNEKSQISYVMKQAA